MKFIAGFKSSRWLTLVGGIWILACAGQTYNFSIYSSALKAALNYNQKQITMLGVFKDLGDAVGLMAGILSAHLPVWAFILIGGLKNFLGYGALWFVTTGRVNQPQFWQVCITMWLAANGATYFNTAGLVTCVGNFPSSRGIVVGLLKSMVGLSGAIFAQLYRALWAPDQAYYLLLAAAGPLLITFVVMAILRPVEDEALEDDQQLAEERRNFTICFALLAILAAYLMSFILLQSFHPLSRLLNQVVASGMLLLLVLPLYLPLSAAVARRKDAHLLLASARGNREHDEGYAPDVPSPSQGKDVPFIESSELDHGVIGGDVTRSQSEKNMDEISPLLAPACPQEVEPSQYADDKSLSGRVEENSEVRWSAKGEPQLDDPDCESINLTLQRDVPISKAVLELDFWLLFLSMLCGAGSGLTAINNLAQIGEAQGITDMQIPVALVSIWNFVGRVGGGYVSEHVVRRWLLPRPLVVGGLQAASAVGHLLFAFAAPGSIVMGSLIVGLSYGATYAMMPAIASEIFGLMHLGMLYNSLTCAVPIGSYLFSGIIAGYIYDWEADHGEGSGAHLTDHYVVQTGEISRINAKQCFGAHCFKLTFIIMAVVSVLGAGTNLWLSMRTKQLYRRLYGVEFVRRH